MQDHVKLRLAHDVILELRRGIAMVHDALADPARPRQSVGEVAAWWRDYADHAIASLKMSAPGTQIVSDAPVAVCHICDIAGCRHIREARRAEFEAKGSALLEAEVAAMQAECGPDVMQVAARQLAKLRAGHWDEQQATGDGKALIALSVPSGQQDHVDRLSAKAGQVRVKPLEWTARYAKYDGGKEHYGTGIFGHWYCVKREKGGVWSIMCHIGGHVCHLPPSKTLEAAKAAAQADYEARILAALDLTPPPAVTVQKAAAVPKKPDGSGIIIAAEGEFSLEEGRCEKHATQEPVALTYTNWRGETSVRSIIPRGVWFGSTEWHPEPQWLLRAWDTEKDAERDFALKDFGQPAPAAQAGQEPVAWLCEERQPMVNGWFIRLMREQPDDSERYRNVTPLYAPEISPAMKAKMRGGM